MLCINTKEMFIAILRIPPRIDLFHNQWAGDIQVFLSDGTDQKKISW